MKAVKVLILSLSSKIKDTTVKIKVLNLALPQLSPYATRFFVDNLSFFLRVSSLSPLGFISISV